MAGLPEDLNELPADIQNYMRKLAEMDIFLTGVCTVLCTSTQQLCMGVPHNQDRVSTMYCAFI